MALLGQRNKAIALRLKGYSYSQIKAKVKVSKSSLSLWLRDHPLSPERIYELQAKNPRRIEHFRNTMAKKREAHFLRAYEKAKKDMKRVSPSTFLVAGFFLYWAEGSKTHPSTVALANTDPEMIKTFIRWLELLGVSRTKIKIYLHLYQDMDIQKEILFWSKELHFPLTSFRKPYIKKTSKDKRKNYKGRFGHGTCNVLYYDQRLYEYVLMGIRHLKEQVLSSKMRTVLRP